MAPRTFSSEEAYLIGILLNGVLWGFFTAVFILFIVVLRNRPPSTPKYTFPNIAVVFLYLLCTSFFAIAMRRCLEAFILFKDQVDPSVYFLVQSNFHPGLIASSVWIYSAVTLLGDSVLVWRCYNVWGRQLWYVSLFPALMVLVTAIGGIGAPSVTLILTTKSPVLAAKFSPLSAVFANMLIITSLLTNLTTTLLIGGRIWWLSFGPGGSSTYSFTNKRFVKVLSLIIETGSFLTIVKVIEFALYRVALGLEQEQFWLVWECVPQVVGIVPTIIVIVVATGYTSTAVVTSTMTNNKTSKLGTMVFAVKPSFSQPSRGTHQAETTHFETGTVATQDTHDIEMGKIGGGNGLTSITDAEESGSRKYAS